MKKSAKEVSTKKQQMRIFCYLCDAPIKRNAVSVVHRVVGTGIDVTGGPLEKYHPECAARKIDQLRGIISDLQNQPPSAA